MFLSDRSIQGENPMKLAACARLFGFAVVLLMLPAFAAAQGSVKCESNDGHRNYCGDYGRNDVSLDRQISGSPCVQGQTWGVDREGLWVDRGCRAYFTVSSRRGGRFDNNSQNSIKCESNDGRSEEHTSELQSRRDLVCRLLLEKKKEVMICDRCVSIVGAVLE